MTVKRWTGLAVTLLALLGIYASSDKLASVIADTVYPKLDLPWSPENAPTATSFPASADIRAVLGGKGEGLGCSIPKVLAAVFFDTDARRESPVPLQLRQACVFHDFCYRHGHATYGYTKENCDVMFQEHAYRLCRQIHQETLPQDECRRRARVALLGVSLGGGKSFQHAHHSTFFEFDPFPTRANDYVVVRAARQPPNRTSDDVHADGALWTFLLKHGWMTFRKFDGSGWGDVGATPFLRGKTPVPPFVVRDAGRDRFLWLARPSLSNSGVYGYAVDATTPEALAHTLPERMGVPGTEYTTCTDRDAQHEPDPGRYILTSPAVSKPKAPYSKHEYDCGTSVSKPLVIDCDGRGPKPLIVTFGYHPWPQNVPNVRGNHLAALCAQSQSAFALASTRAGLEKSGYRFAQNEFLTGRFIESSSWGLIALGRGHYGDDDPRTDAAVNWTENVSVIFKPLTGVIETYRSNVRLTEADEPLAPLRADGDTAEPDRLIALVNPCSPRTDCNIEVREWLPHRGWMSSKSTLSLSVEWLRQPPQVVSARGAPRGDWLLLSRVVSKRDGSTLDDKSFVPDAVQLEYHLLRRAPEGWQGHGTACLRVDLARQMLTHEGAGLIDRYLFRDFRWLLGTAASATSSVETPTQICARSDPAMLQAEFHKGEEAIGLRKPDELSWHGIMACVALRRDLAERWHRSQVVPGYLFAPSGTETSNSERLPDVAFMFNGFPRHSVVTRRGIPVQTEWAKPCAPS